MKNEKTKFVALNTQNFIWMFLLVLFVALSVICFTDRSIVMGIIFLVISAAPVAVILLSPLYYVFTDEGVTIVYTIGGQEIIDWKKVNTVRYFGSWIAKGSGSPHYYIAHYGDKTKRYMNSEIAKTMKTKKLMELYCHDKIKK